ncbi:hypothetical protein P879_08383 [Paragonimus westermani]|uniref:Uncharacterized protein n=1 Tax=Paragonimus westermani TaxID=34504 RepID=A0A8T0DHE4_9TREM|nr:hypothetical protein P879_08383 [Paragonimus westermani]
MFTSFFSIPLLVRREHARPHSPTWISANKKSINIASNEATTRQYNQVNSAAIGLVCDQLMTEHIAYTRLRPYTTAACAFERNVTQDDRFPAIPLNSRSLTARPQFHT